MSDVIAYCESLKLIVKDCYPAAYAVWEAEPEGFIKLLQAKGFIKAQRLNRVFDMPYHKGTNNISAWVEYREAIYTFITSLNDDEKLKQAREQMSTEIWQKHYKQYPKWPAPGQSQTETIAIDTEGKYNYQKKYIVVWSCTGSIKVTDDRPTATKYKAAFSGRPTLKILQANQKLFMQLNKLCQENKNLMIQKAKKYCNNPLTFDDF